MIQIAFEPAFDPFHTTFRLLQQLEYRGRQQVEIARLKILDVFVAEPRRCMDIRLPLNLKKVGKSAAACQSATYGHRPSKQVFFNRMVPIQNAALQTLVMKKFLDDVEFQKGFALRTIQPLPDELRHRIEEVNGVELALLDFLVNKLDVIPFHGLGGLKDRTGLGEYRYDLV